ncbi:MAG TPA: class I SAM-dependent methyltransferase [Candidatus Eisenbacteria bacterium]|nr:class I SAM-dependent methyltransferase [Candidatus Eisenbacteria bacterium]
MSDKLAADDVLRDIEIAAKKEYLPIIGASKGDALERFVQERAPRTAVEVGVMSGYSTIRIARNLGEGARVIGIEISEELARQAEKNIERAGLADRCEVRRGDAHDVLRDLQGEVDLVFLDAERGQYLNYLRALEPKLAPGAIVVANGATHQRMERYLDHVRMSGRYESTFEAIDDDGIEVSRFRG